MFKPRRSALVKRLWKNRISQYETVGKNETPEETELKATTQSILKRLKEKNLEILIQSIESKGGESTPCVLLPSGDIKLGKRTVAPNMLCCQIWRWPDLASTSVLRQLPCCETVGDPSYTCCNPYHWSIQQKTDNILPYLNEMDSSPGKFSELEWSDDGVMDVVSTETGETPTPYQRGSTVASTDITGTDSVRGSTHWCTVAYWELRQRVGRLYTVKELHVNIFQDLPHGSGLALKLLQGKSDLDSVKRTREKIGFGIILSKEQDGVWMYNRSLFPIFVNSPTLDIPNSRRLVVVKVNPGYSLKIFDYDIARVIKGIRDPNYLDGPYDPSSIRISFAKGWGPTYHRQFITSCPCWVEVLLNVNR